MSRDRLREIQALNRARKADRAFGGGAGGRSSLPHPMGGIRQGGSRQPGILVQHVPPGGATAVGQSASLPVADVTDGVFEYGEPIFARGWLSVGSAGPVTSVEGYFDAVPFLDYGDYEQAGVILLIDGAPHRVFTPPRPWRRLGGLTLPYDEVLRGRRLGLLIDRPGVPSGSVNFRLVDPFAGEVQPSVPVIEEATVQHSARTSGHSTSNDVRTLQVPAGAVAGDLIVVVGQNMAWADFSPGLPTVGSIVSSLTFTALSTNHTLANRSVASAWVRVLGAGEGGEDVTVTFTKGGAYAFASALWMFHVPGGALSSYTANEFASLVGGETETIAPSTPSGTVHLGLVTAQRYDGGNTPPAINAPGGANWHLHRRANRARAALTSIPAAGAATWESSGGDAATTDPLHLRAWRIGLS